MAGMSPGGEDLLKAALLFVTDSQIQQEYLSFIFLFYSLYYLFQVGKWPEDPRPTLTKALALALFTIVGNSSMGATLYLNVVAALCRIIIRKYMPQRTIEFLPSEAILVITREFRRITIERYELDEKVEKTQGEGGDTDI